MTTRHESDSDSNSSSGAESSGTTGSSDSSPRSEQRHHETPESVHDFISDFALSVREKKIPALLDLYSTQFNKLTETLYRQSEWPSLNYSYAKSTLSSPHAQCLYKELTYRHILTHLKDTVDQRIEAWHNYCALFRLMLDDLVVDPTVEGKIVLPAPWFWDLLDEFVYHYQKYVSFRAKTLYDAKSAEQRSREGAPVTSPDAETLTNNPGAWDTKELMSLLEELVSKSRIQLYLQRVREGSPKDGADMPCESARLIGYFALVQLCRVHTLHGDYHTALKTIDMLDFKAPLPLYCTAPSCHVSLFYYVGFAYMMMKRYYDATRTFSHILLYLAKSRATAQYQDRMQDKCFTLLLICVTLCPGGLDDQVSKLIAEKSHSDIHAKLQASLASRDDDKLQVFDDRFIYACPKFITPAATEETENASWNEAHTRQLHVFLNEVRQMKMLPTLTSYMKLYTTIPLEKLAKFCETDVENLKQQMVALKHKSKQLVHPADSVKGPLYGEEMNCSDIEFHIDDEKVHVSVIKEEVSYSQVFLKCIAHMQDLKNTMDSDYGFC